MQSQAVEDYLHAILEFTAEKGYARTKDISVRLGKAPSTVAEMFRRLQEMGYVTYRPYEGVTLTPEGARVARLVHERHEIVEAFLRLIFVPVEKAHRDAHIMEHELSPATLEQVSKLVDYLERCEKDGGWREGFRSFCVTGALPGKRECPK